MHSAYVHVQQDGHIQTDTTQSNQPGELLAVSAKLRWVITPKGIVLALLRKNLTIAQAVVKSQTPFNPAFHAI
jgi:hypothetical protein